MTDQSIPQLRADLAIDLMRLVRDLQQESDNHLASILPAEIGQLVHGLSDLHGRVNAQRAVAFAKR